MNQPDWFPLRDKCHSDELLWLFTLSQKGNWLALEVAQDGSATWRESGMTVSDWDDFYRWRKTLSLERP